MKSKDLLFQLSRMEHSLHDFSFEELTATEASFLKKSFESFKVNLEKKIFQPSQISSAHLEVPVELLEENTTTETRTQDVNMLIARVSHEIRTPLNGIIGFADLLKEDDQLNDKQQSQVSAIQKASFALLEIIGELLDYSKLSTGVERFEKVDFDFRSTVGDVKYLCETLISDKDIVLKTEIDPNIPRVLLGDPSKLTQILLNLVGNAIKFVEKGSILVKIEPKTTRNRTVFLEFIVEDTGIGIAKEHLEHIFDSFKQGRPDTFVKYGGSGLGLNIVKKIIENLGGRIKVSSVLGEGSKFTFSIPYQIGKLTPVSKQKSTSSPNSEKERVADLDILVFEDNTLNQRLVEQQLQSWGCRAYITDDAEQGLRLLENKKIDIVLMDLKMPVLNGFQVSRLIRGHEMENVKNIPIIAISADFSEDDKKRCELHQINDFLLKPYRTDELLTKLIKNRKKMNRTLHVESTTINPSAKNHMPDQQVNLSFILEECMGQVSLLEELVTLYKQNALEFIGASRIHLKNNDIEQLQFAAHKLKAGLKMMQSHGLHAIIEQIQNCCKTNADVKHLEFLFNCFVEEYPKVEKAIDAQMNVLKA